jgi:hypothetical protein
MWNWKEEEAEFNTARGIKKVSELSKKITNLLTYSMEQSLFQKLTVNFAASQEISRIYGTRNFLTVPTCPYPEPTPSSPHDSIQLPENPS